MKFSKVIEDSINTVKGDGFWCGATILRLRVLITALIKEGVKDETIAATVLGFWTTVEAEYGE